MTAGRPATEQHGGWLQVRHPPPELASAVMSVWTATTATRREVLPDGCVSVAWLEPGELWLCGPAPVATMFRRPAGREIVGLDLRPGVAPRVLGPRAVHAMLTSGFVPMIDAVEPDIVATVAAAVAGTDDRSAALTDAIAPLIVAAPEPDPLETALTAALTRRPATSINAIADEIAVSPRHLRRLAQELYGLPPTTLSRIVRLQSFLRIGRAHPDRSLSQVASDAGYFDHAHLCREARSIANRPPSAILHDFDYCLPDGPDPYTIPT